VTEPWLSVAERRAAGEDDIGAFKRGQGGLAATGGALLHAPGFASISSSRSM